MIVKIILITVLISIFLGALMATLVAFSDYDKKEFKERKKGFEIKFKKQFNKK